MGELDSKILVEGLHGCEAHGRLFVFIDLVCSLNLN